MEELDDSMPKGIYHWQSINKYQRIVKTLLTIGCRFSNVNGGFCDCRLFQSRPEDSGLFTIGAALNTPSSDIDETALIMQVDYLKGVRCNQCNHSADEHLKLMYDPFDFDETFEVFMLGSDIVRLDTFSTHELEPVTSRTFSYIRSCLSTVLYNPLPIRNLWPYSMSYHYIKPPFEFPTIDYLVTNLAIFFCKPGTSHMCTTINIAKYFLKYLNDWELPRCDSDIILRKSSIDQAMYRAFYELWLSFCYVPGTSLLLKKYTASRIFGARFLILILPDFMKFFSSHITRVRSQVTEQEPIPFELLEHGIDCLDDLDFFITSITHELSDLHHHLFHFNCITVELATEHKLVHCLGVLYREQCKRRFAAMKMDFRPWPIEYHGFRETHCEIQNELLMIEEGLEARIRKDLSQEEKERRLGRQVESIANLDYQNKDVLSVSEPELPAVTVTKYVYSTDAFGEVVPQKKLLLFHHPPPMKYSNLLQRDNRPFPELVAGKTVSPSKNGRAAEVGQESDLPKLSPLTKSPKAPAPLLEGLPAAFQSAPFSAPLFAIAAAQAPAPPVTVTVPFPVTNGHVSTAHPADPVLDNKGRKLVSNGDVSASAPVSQALPAAFNGLSRSNGTSEQSPQSLEGDNFYLRMSDDGTTLSFSLICQPGQASNESTNGYRAAMPNGIHSHNCCLASTSSVSQRKLESLQSGSRQQLCPLAYVNEKGEPVTELIKSTFSPTELGLFYQSNLSPSAGSRQSHTCGNQALQHPNIAALLCSESSNSSSSLSFPEIESSPEQSPEHSALSIAVNLPSTSNGASKGNNENLLSPERNNILNKSMFVNPKRSLSPKNKSALLLRSPSSSSLLSPSGNSSSPKNGNTSPDKNENGSLLLSLLGTGTAEKTLAWLASIDPLTEVNATSCSSSTPLRQSQAELHSDAATSASSSFKRDLSFEQLSDNSSGCSPPSKGTKCLRKKYKKPSRTDRESTLEKGKITCALSNGVGRAPTLLATNLNGHAAASNSADSSHSYSDNSRSAASIEEGDSHSPAGAPAKQVTDEASSKSTSPSVSRRLFANSPAKAPDLSKSPGKGRSPDGRRVRRTINLRHRKVVCPGGSAMGGFVSFINQPPTKRSKKALAAGNGLDSDTPGASFLDISSDSTVILSDLELEINCDVLNQFDRENERKPPNECPPKPELTASERDARLAEVLLQIKATHLHAENIPPVDSPQHTEISKRKVLLLLELQNLISNQLPNMGQDYINDIIVKRGTRSVVLLKNKRVIGAFTFRPFKDYNFTEVIFCVITTREQVKGYGTIMMNIVKEHCVKMGITRLLTYADNFAIEFFRKRGFTKTITVPKIAYEENITLCAGAELMECKLDGDFQCPPSYERLFTTEWASDQAATFCDAAVAQEPARRIGTNGHGEPKRSRRSQVNGGPVEVQLAPLPPPSGVPVPKKRGRKPTKKLLLDSSSGNAQANQHALTGSGPSEEEWRRMDEYLRVFQSQTGSGIFRKANPKVVASYRYAQTLEQIVERHNRRNHYRSVRMLYYDLTTMMRGFQYTSKKSSSFYKTAYRLERFNRKYLKDHFGIDESL